MASAVPVRETLLSGRPPLSERDKKKIKCQSATICKIFCKSVKCDQVLAHNSPGAIWTLQPESCCILLICSPPLPMTVEDTVKTLLGFSFSCVNHHYKDCQYDLGKCVHVLTETDHAVRDPVLFRHCRGPDTVGGLDTMM